MGSGNILVLPGNFPQIMAWTNLLLRPLRGMAVPQRMSTPHLRYPIVGIEKLAPSLMPLGQREVTVLVLV